MKKILLGFFSTIMTIAVFTSCDSSSDDAPQINNGKVSESQFNKLVSTISPKTFSVQKVKTYRRNSGTDEKWTKFDPTEYIGLQYVDAQTITFCNGKIIIPLDLFTCSRGPHPLSVLWAAYRQSARIDAKLYYENDNAIVYPELSLKTGHITYKIEKLSDSRIVLSHTSKYYAADGKVKGEYLFVLEYAKTTQVEAGVNGAEVFASRNEALAYILKCAREKFGSRVNLNTIFTNVIYDNPIVDIDELQRRFEAGEFDAWWN